MSLIPGSVSLTGFIAPTDSTDVFAVTKPIYGLGGLRTVSGMTELSAITTQRREVGMIVYVSGTSEYYKLESGLTNSDWTLLNIGSGSSISGYFLALSGGTVTGDTYFTQGLSAFTFSAGTINSGSTNLYDIFLTGPQTYVQPGLNTYTGGTPSAPTINISAATLSYVSATTLSAGTINSGSTNLYDIFLTIANSAATGNFIPMSGTGANLVTGDVTFDDAVNIAWTTGSDFLQYNPVSTNVELTTSNGFDLTSGAMMSAGTDLYAIFGTGSGSGFSGWTSSTGVNSIIANNGTLNIANNSFAIVGGNANSGTGLYTVVVNGKTNLASGNGAFIGGGSGHTASGTRSFIGNGGDNIASGNGSFIGGGQQHLVSGSRASIVGGRQNSATTTLASVVGGRYNLASGPYSFIGNGRNNIASAYYSFIGTGTDNLASGYYSLVLAGYSNSATSSYSFVVGGAANIASSNYSFIVGGNNNRTTGSNASIFGGASNSASGLYSTVLNGFANSVTGARSAVIGGDYITGTTNDTVYVPYFNIHSANTNNVLTNVLVRDSNGDIYLSSAFSAVTGNFIPMTGTGANLVTGDVTFDDAVNIAWTTGSDFLQYNPVSTNVELTTSNGFDLTSGAMMSAGTDLYNIFSTTASTGGTGFSGWTSSTGVNSIIANNGTSNVASSDFSVIAGSGGTVSGLASSIGGGIRNTIISTASFIGAGTGNTIFSGGSFIGSGSGNTASGTYSSIVSGRRNIASASRSFIGNGQQNSATTTYATVVNGILNRATAFGSFVGNGSQNIAASQHGFVGAGQGNVVSGSGYNIIVGGKGNSNTSTQGFSFLGGGAYNSSTGKASVVGGGVSNLSSGNFYSAVVGGRSNSATADYSFVGGGWTNRASADKSTVVGGSFNNAAAANTFIGGGLSNTASSYSTSIVGGENNIATINAFNAFIGGGKNNLINAQYTLIGGGRNNNISGVGNIIVGGSFNSVVSEYSSYSIIGGGTGNIISGVPYASFAHVIGGGQENFIDNNGYLASYSNFIGGGTRNSASTTSFSVIGGGRENLITDYTANVSIVGGRLNIASGSYSFIGGGYLNLVSGAYSSIIGGQSNSVSGNAAFVGGGSNNSANGIFSNIAGGYKNKTTALYSNVGGGQNNLASGIHSSVVGGNANNAGGIRSFVGGGQSNTGSTNYSVVVGGQNNTASGNKSFIGNGRQNTVSGAYSSIINGRVNNVSGQASGIFAGTGNTVSGNLSAIIGGSGITASANSTVYVPFFNIQSASTNNALTNILVRDSNGDIYLRDASTLSGGSSGATITASNGLTKTGDNISLGGALTANTSVTGLFTLNLGSGTGTSRLSSLSTRASGTTQLISIIPGVSTASLTLTTGTTSFGLNSPSAGIVGTTIVNENSHTSQFQDGGTVFTESQLELSGATLRVYDFNADENHFKVLYDPIAITNNGIDNRFVVSDTLSQKGIIYSADYSSNFTPESLVTKRYVDNAITGVTTGSTGNFLPLSGGTVTGNTIFTTNVSASTLTLTTTNVAAPLNLPLFTSNPASPVDGDTWLLVTAGTVYLNIQYLGATKTVQLT